MTVESRWMLTTGPFTIEMKARDHKYWPWKADGCLPEVTLNTGLSVAFGQLIGQPMWWFTHSFNWSPIRTTNVSYVQLISYPISRWLFHSTDRLLELWMVQTHWWTHASISGYPNSHGPTFQLHSFKMIAYPDYRYLLCRYIIKVIDCLYVQLFHQSNYRQLIRSWRADILRPTNTFEKIIYHYLNYRQAIPSTYRLPLLCSCRQKIDYLNKRSIIGSLNCQWYIR